MEKLELRERGIGIYGWDFDFKFLVDKGMHYAGKTPRSMFEEFEEDYNKYKDELLKIIEEQDENIY